MKSAPQKRKDRKAPARRSRDRVLEEFEDKDLGEAMAKATWTPVAPKKMLTTTITLDRKLVEKLRQKGARRGLGYQTMLKMIVLEHIDEY